MTDRITLREARAIALRLAADTERQLHAERLAEAKRDCYLLGTCQGHCTGPLYCDLPDEEARWTS